MTHKNAFNSLQALAENQNENKTKRQRSAQNQWLKMAIPIHFTYDAILKVLIIAKLIEINTTICIVDIVFVVVVVVVVGIII